MRTRLPIISQTTHGRTVRTFIPVRGNRSVSSRRRRLPDSHKLTRRAAQCAKFTPRLWCHTHTHKQTPERPQHTNQPLKYTQKRANFPLWTHVPLSPKRRVLTGQTEGRSAGSEQHSAAAAPSQSSRRSERASQGFASPPVPRGCRQVAEVPAGDGAE